MTTRLSGTTSLRPIRFGFLVRPSDKKSVSRIMRWSTCLWGGRCNPIIPVGRYPAHWRSSETILRKPDQEVARNYMHFFEPDIIVEAEPGLAESIGYGALSNSSLESQLISLDELHSKKWSGHRTDLYVGQSVVDIYQADYEAQHQFVLRKDIPVLLFKEDRLAPLVEAVFGAFPNDEGANYFKNFYEDAYSPKLVAPDPDAWLSVFRGKAKPPFYPTFFDLDIDPKTRREATFFIFDHTKITDLIEYWNTRLFEALVFPVPLCWLDELKSFVSNEIQANHRPIPNNRFGTMFTSQVVFARSVKDEVARRAVESFSSDCPDGSFFIGRSIHPKHSDSWNGPRCERHSVKSDETRLSLEVEGGSVSFPMLYPKFAERYGGGRYRWANVVNLGTHGPTDLALCYPSNIKDRTFPHLAMGQQGPIVSREGWVLLEQYQESSGYLRIDSGTDAICRWLKKKGIEAKRSSAGRIALQMVEKLASLRAADLIADKDTIQLLNKMAMQERTSHSKSTSNTKTFEGRTADTGRWHELVKKRAKNSFRFRASLEQFTNRGILKLGLGLNCPHCTHSNWYGLDRVDYSVTCERCLKKFPYPQGSKEPRWKYRVTGPFSVPNFAEGAYAVTLTLTTFAKRLSPVGDISMTMTTGLNLTCDAFAREIDFAFWYSKERMLDQKSEPHFVVGEAKSFAAEAIEKADLEALQAVAKVLPGTILVVSVLKESFSAAEKRLLKKLVRWGWVSVEGHMRAPVIMLTGVELFADWTVKKSWQEKGAPYPADADMSVFSDLELFAMETQRIHLGMDYHSHLDQKYKAGRQT